jgi:Tfp pilus assembly protein PilF
MRNTWQALRQAAALDNPSAQHALAKALWESGEKVAALAAFRKAAERDPICAQYHLSLARALRSVGDTEAALYSLREALALGSEYAEIHIELGDLLSGLPGQEESASRSYVRAARISPEDTRHILPLCAVLLQGLDAGSTIKCVMELTGFEVSPLMVRKAAAQILADHLGRYADARELWSVALELSPADVEALLGLAEVHVALRDFRGARAVYQAASALPPTARWALFQHVKFLMRLGRVEEAYALFRKRQRSIVRMIRSFEAAQARTSPARGYTPTWDGADPHGRTILLHDGFEFGFGDTIQYIRFAKSLVKRGARVITECRRPLHSLFSASPELGQIIAPLDECPEPEFQADFAFAGMLLPDGWQRAASPYISVPAEAARKWSKALAADRSFRVGVMWEAGPRWVRNSYRNRSLALTALRPLSEIPGITLYSLQFGPGVEQLSGAGFPITPLNVGDFGDTAGALAQLDLIVTVDTSLAHLAGACGVEAFVLLPHFACWRWMVEGSHSVSYPSLTLFRQHTPGDWTGVVQDVTAAAQQRVSAAEAVA